MTRDWILRVGNGNNLVGSSQYKIWGIQSTTNSGKCFVNNVRPGDRLWFVTAKSKGKIIAVATYCSHNKRELGPLVNISMTNEQLNWTHDGPRWISDTEIHYTDLYNLTSCEMLTHISGNATIRRYNEKCRVNLPIEYNYIVRYRNITHKL